MKKTLKWNIAQKAELRWWQAYLRKKDVADYRTWKLNYWQGVLQKIAPDCPILPGMEILDAGCGPAGMFMALPDCAVDAMDPLLDDYAAALPHFNKADYPNVRFFHSPLETFTPDKTYDIVFCMNAINHVSDIGLSYDKLTSWVKPGGKLVVSIDAHNHAFFRHLFRMIPGDILHPHQYNLKEYELFLTDRGMDIISSLRLKKEFFFDHYVQIAVRKG
ncbi:MAG: hypothetical protein ABR94_01730 [Sphingobacteriales bacterium BACL12 MAG-120802-bin5]|nr:MAG: hypothetical protein ABR94_01730 [Sphingobacteriales bacterium BACL12 MAG-120802-bin5]